MNTKLKNQINDLRFSIYGYERGLTFSRRSSILHYAKKLINESNIVDLLNEFNSISSDKIDVEKAMNYIKESKETQKSKNLKEEDHIILSMFDEVLVDQAKRLKESCETYFNKLRDDFVAAYKIKPIDVFAYAKQKITYQKPENMSQYQYDAYLARCVGDDPTYQLIHSLSFSFLDDVKWSEWLEKRVNAIVKANKQKLFSVVLRKLKNLEIEKVDKQYIHTGDQGFEGNFSLTLKDQSTKGFNVKSINAGGYNIQCLHYRFLAKITK